MTDSTPTPAQSLEAPSAASLIARLKENSAHYGYDRIAGDLVVRIRDDLYSDIIRTLSDSSPAPTAPGESDCPQTRALMDQLSKFGYSAANDRATSLCWKLEREVLALREQLAWVIAALRKYGDHYPECDYIQTVGRGCVKRCSCGFLAALPASAAEGEGK